MEINKYLKIIDISASNEDQVKLFLSNKGADIQTYIELEWNDFLAAQLKAQGEVHYDKPEDNNKIVVKEETIITEPNLPEIDVRVIASNDELLNKTPETNSDVKNSQVLELSKLNSLPVKDIVITENNAITLTQDEALREKEKKLSQEKEKKSTEAFEQQIKSKNIVIPNGKVNQEYCVVFKIEDLGLSDINFYWFEGIDAYGLEYDAQTNEIKGLPKEAGEFKLKLKIKRNDWTEGKPIFEREVTLIINPDPKSLWKYIPTPLDIEYYKPDSDSEFIKVEGNAGMFGLKKSIKKDMVAASQRGRSHAHEGKARDDDFGLDYCKKNEWYIMTVADGAGGSKSSRKGSEIACRTTINECKKHIEANNKQFEQILHEYNYDRTDANRKKVGDILYNIIGSSVFRSLKNIDHEAKATSKPIKDFSTTLIIAICKKFKYGWFIGAFWVGDGGIAIFQKENQYLNILGESDGGEFAGQTRFLTMPEITQPVELYRRLRFDIVDDFTALILMTDGVSDPKFETDANLGKFDKWNELWNDLSKEVRFTDDNKAVADQLLNWLDFWSPGNHDDRTIAILF